MTNVMMRMVGKVIIVTASTRGIGLACVRRLAEEGGIVYMAVRNLEKAQELIEEFKKEGLNVKAVYCDAYKYETYHEMVEEIIKNEGHIDVLVNNFGTSDTRKDLDIEKTDFETFMDIVTVNLASVYLAGQAVLPYMAKQKYGSIINISSIGGVVPDISQIAYGTSKAAIDYLTKLVAVQAGRQNIRCNAVLPGMTATDAVEENLSDEFKEVFLKQIPIKRMGMPKEIAALVAYFASDGSAYTTGQIVEVCGGFGLATPVFGDFASSARKR